MRFTNPGLLLGLCLALLVAACSSGPKPAKPTGDDEATAASRESSILPEGPVSPNPYLQDVPRLSSGLQQEFNLALAAMEQQRWAEAEQRLQRLSREHSRYSGLALNLGLVYRAQGDLAKAEQAFTEALSRNSKNLDAYNQLAILKREAGDFAAAEDLYRQALAVWPYHPESHRNLGILYDLYLGREAEALAHYRAYRQLLQEEDRQLESWIADLERRLGAQASGG